MIPTLINSSDAGAAGVASSFTSALDSAAGAGLLSGAGVLLAGALLQAVIASANVAASKILIPFFIFSPISRLAGRN
jgi:tryptophan-rich sensory protein